MSSAAPLGNLPVDMTSFVDRTRETARARQLLHDHRLVTFTGPGGVGKSRLAVRVAAQNRRAYPDGVWHVELAPLDDPRLLAQTVSDRLGAERSSEPPLTAMREFLRTRRLLLVLDNCEHLIDACAELVSALLACAPGLTVLATGRQPLGIDGEHLLPVPPLAVPPADRRLTLAELREYGAVRLLLIRGGLTVHAANREPIAQLCRRLEGIPLAIELAAARLPGCGPEALLDRLDQRFEPRAGSGPANPRQQTMLATVAWSFGLCSAAEGLLWERLSVCAGGFDLAAAEQIATGPGLPGSQVLDTLTGLVDKSVVTRENDGHRTRYRMLETIRQYGRDRLLGRAELTGRRRAHRDHYLAMALDFQSEWHGPDQARWSRRCDADLGNLRAALEFSLSEPGDAPEALRLVTALGWYWAACGAVQEGQLWLNRCLAAAPEPTELRAGALWVAALTALVCGDLPTARLRVDEGEALARGLGSAATLAYAIQYQATMAMYQGETARALDLYREALDRHRRGQDALAICLTQIKAALCHSTRATPGSADLTAAIALSRAAIADAEAAGEVWLRSWGQTLMGLALWVSGRPAEAGPLLLESIRAKRAFADRVGLGMSLEVLMWSAAAAGRAAEAACLTGAVESVLTPIGTSFFAIPTMVRYRDQATARIRKSLSAREFDAARRRGLRFDLAQAVAYAEELLSTPPAPQALTRRQLEVAELVALGLSNKEIARELTIAQRTAEAHLEHILARLGLRSRSQVAAWVAQRIRR
ncbi:MULTISPECIES: LuxR C-terminal-related transcriptional regulator [unclassified Crossiella]|uniref:ATP-binding protein n=1 Tax=unclassified Crossiella TaxID=2620835 RepID=UPI001FFFA8B7|nr:MULTISPECIES: LuxR C-terminal-related transcriptional regulator [unclassified Crossiella]MCK2238518.1 LuxR C-terminal-related transcriptional regulator [Crossiella sp. S99.2]MCK2251912.1 LuxR C-terminal-related transcriptional regulator [Crossiella sp. S99.1]